MWTTLGGDGNLAAFQLIFNTGANNARTEAMRLTSTSLYTASGINVGIGTSSPGAKLDAVITDGTAYNSATAGVYVARVRNLFGSAGNTQALISHNCDNYSSVWNSGLVETSGGSFTGAYVWQNRTGSTTYAERMRLDSSGNLGLGVTPSAWSSLWSAEQFGQAGSLFSYKSGSNYTVISNNSYAAGGNYQGTDARYTNDGYATAYVQNNSGQHLWLNAASGTAGVGVTFTQAMTLDASGRLGIGTTAPNVTLDVVSGSTNAAGDSLTVQTASVTGANLAFSNNVGVLNVATNTAAGIDVGGSIGFGGRWTSNIQAGFALIKGAKENSGANYASYLAFYTRPDGSGLSERARITSGGILHVNTTDNGFTSALRLSVVGASGEGAFLFKNDAGASQWTGWVWNTATSGDNLFINFMTEAGGTGRGSITYNRGGGLLAFNTTSDYRSKDIIGPVINSGATIDALKVYIGKMKGATIERPMLIAHEAQAAAPYSVTGKKDAVNDKGDPIFQQIDHASLVPLLIAEIQSLRARVAQLEAK
jgi:hypothetical protein